MRETIGTWKYYKNILSASSKLLTERAQAVKLTSQPRKAFNKVIGKISFSNTLAMPGDQGR